MMSEFLLRATAGWLVRLSFVSWKQKDKRSPVHEPRRRAAKMRGLSTSGAELLRTFLKMATPSLGGMKVAVLVDPADTISIVYTVSPSLFWRAVNP